MVENCPGGELSGFWANHLSLLNDDDDDDRNEDKYCYACHNIFSITIFNYYCELIYNFSYFSPYTHLKNILIIKGTWLI